MAAIPTMTRTIARARRTCSAYPNDGTHGSSSALTPSEASAGPGSLPRLRPPPWRLLRLIHGAVDGRATCGHDQDVGALSAGNADGEGCEPRPAGRAQRPSPGLREVSALRRRRDPPSAPGRRARRSTWPGFVSASSCAGAAPRRRPANAWYRCWRSSGRCSFPRSRPYRAGSLLKAQIPIKTWLEWDEARPGFVEIDLVGHEGGNSFGEFCFTFTMTTSPRAGR